MADREKPPERGAFAMFGALTGIGSLSAFCVALGVGVGWWLDERTSAPHVFVFLGLALGVAAAVLSTWSIVKRIL
ncbi:MAG: AtpZ/AtpI family protein [Actinomycetes bacterium]